MSSYRWGKELTVLTMQMTCAVQVQAYCSLSENKGRDVSLDLPIDTWTWPFAQLNSTVLSPFYMNPIV